MDKFCFLNVGGMIVSPEGAKGPQGIILPFGSTSNETGKITFGSDNQIYQYQNKLIVGGNQVCITSYAGKNKNIRNSFPLAFNGATFSNASAFQYLQSGQFYILKEFVENNGADQVTNDTSNMAFTAFYTERGNSGYDRGETVFAGNYPVTFEAPFVYFYRGLRTPVISFIGNPDPTSSVELGLATSTTSTSTALYLVGSAKNKRFTGLDGVPTLDTDATNKKYVDDIKEYGIEHSPVLDSGQEEFVLGQNDLAYVFKNSMVMDSGDRFYFADPVSLTDGRLVPFITSAMTGEEYHLLVGTYPKGVQNGTLAPVQIDGVATPTGDNMAANKKYVDDLVEQGGGTSGEYIPLSGTASGKPVTGNIVFDGQHSVTGLSTPTVDSSAANKQYVDNAIKSITENQVTIQKADNANMCINLTVDGDEASGILDLTDKNGNPVIVRGVDTPVQDTDAVNKKYFETHLSTDFIPTKDLDMKQYKLINTSAVEIYGGINDSANNTYFIRETSQASINTDTEIPEYVKVITGVHTGDTNQDVILRGIRAGQQKNDAVNYNQFKTLADSFERCQHDVESLNAWKMTFDENQVANTVNSIIKYTDVAYELTIASGEEQWYSYDLAMQSGYTPISATLVIDDTNPFVGHCSLDITPDGTYNALIYLKSQGDDKTCNCKVRLVWIKNQ